MLSNISRIFKSRKDKAITDLKKAHDALEFAKKSLDDARKALKEYREFRIQKERELYDEFFKQLASSKDLAVIKGKVGMLLAGDASYEARICECEKKLDDAMAALEEARSVFIKSTEKLDNWSNHVADWNKEQAIVDEIKQEDDLENLFSQPGGSAL